MLPEEKMMVERMLAEGKINEEEAKSLIKVLEGEKDILKLEKKQTQPKVNYQSLGNIIKKFFQSGDGDIFNKGDKYKVVRNLSGEFAGETTQEINIFARNGQVQIKEQKEPGYKMKVELMVKAENQEEAERKVEEKDFIRTNEKGLEIDCGEFPGANLDLYLSSDTLYKLKSEIHNGTYYIEKNQYEKIDLETHNGAISVIDIETITGKIKSRNGKIDYSGYGKIDISTLNGKLDIVVKEKKGLKTAVNLLTRNGKCKVKVPAESLSYLDCQTGYGKINLAIDNIKYIKNKKTGSSQHIIAEKMGETREAGINCKVETGNGQIDLVEI